MSLFFPSRSLSGTDPRPRHARGAAPGPGGSGPAAVPKPPGSLTRVPRAENFPPVGVAAASSLFLDPFPPLDEVRGCLTHVWRHM